jgi:hypothetical protein
MEKTERTEERPNLSLLALVSFITSFAVARVFTRLKPDSVLIGGGYHVHHFWFGLIMVIIGGWIGISYTSERADRVAAIIFGAGGGLIGDEVGLLLTLGNYWTEITYTLIVVFVTFASMLSLFFRYSEKIRIEFTKFIRSNISLYFGVFLSSISVAFILESDDFWIIDFSIVSEIVALIIIITYFILMVRRRH